MPDLRAALEAAERFIDGEYKVLLDCSCPKSGGEPIREEVDPYAAENVEEHEAILALIRQALEAAP